MSIIGANGANGEISPILSEILSNGSPIKWYSKRQDTVEASAYGSEYTALRIAGEMIEALLYRLRMMGIALDGPANGFVDNESIVFNTIIPSSCLKKHFRKHTHTSKYIGLMT